MITEPTNKSKEAMEAKTLVVPPKERTEEGGLPSGGEVGQVLTKTSDGAEWAAQSVGLCKNTSSSTKISFNVPDTTTLPSTVGGSDNWTVSTVEVPDEIMNILNGQYEGGTYATSVVNVIVGYPDPDDPEETMEIVGKVFLNYRVRYISNGNMSLSFDQFNYISSSGKLYIITLPDITYYNNEWSAQGSDIYVECLMGNA